MASTGTNYDCHSLPCLTLD